MTHDVRSVANLVLEVASREGAQVTNLAVNKIVYFVYVDYLLACGAPLSVAKIEAWEHGPVFRELYSALKSFGDKPIEGRITKIDPMTGHNVECKIECSESELAFIEPIIRKLLKLSASKLRALSHLEGGPWHRVWCHSGESNAGMHISDAIIVDSLSTLRRQ